MRYINQYTKLQETYRTIPEIILLFRIQTNGSFKCTYRLTLFMKIRICWRKKGGGSSWALTLQTLQVLEFERKNRLHFNNADSLFALADTGCLIY